MNCLSEWRASKPVDREFRSRVEAAIGHRDVLAKQPIGADDLLTRVTFDRTIEHEEVVAYRVEVVHVATPAHRVGGQLGVHLFHEYAVAHGLCGVDLGSVARKARLKVADASKHIDRSCRCAP